MTVPFGFNPDGSLRLSGIGLTVFTYDGDPTGHLSGLAEGDLCISSTAALYQWVTGGSPTWVQVSFSSSGLYNSTNGISINDDSSNGIVFVENNGNTALFLGSGQIGLETESGGFILQPDGHVQFNTVNLFTWTSGGGPNGNVVGLQTGDLCLTSEPGLYQWSADATPIWRPVGFGGTYSGTTGISLTDNSSNPITILQSGSGNIALGANGGLVSLENTSGSFTVQSDGSLELTRGLGLNFVFVSDGNPNGTITANGIGDLCITSEPRLYQAAAADNASWVPFTILPATYAFNVVPAGPYAGFAQRSTALPLLGGTGIVGSVVDSLAVPMFVYPAGLVVEGINLSIVNIPPCFDGFDILASIAVVSLDGTDVMNLSFSTLLAPNVSNGSVNANQFAVSSQTGSDLTFNTGTGQVSTTAGGAYAVMMSVNFQWD